MSTTKSELKTGGSPEVDPEPTSVVSSDVSEVDCDQIHGLTASQVAIGPEELGTPQSDCDDPPMLLPVQPENKFPLAVPGKDHVCLQVLHYGNADEPVRFKFDGQPTVDQLQTAECTMRGFKRKADHVFEDGVEVSPTHALKVGSLYLLDFGHDVSSQISSCPNDLLEFRTGLDERSTSVESVVVDEPFGKIGGSGLEILQHDLGLDDPWGKLNEAGFLIMQPPVVSGLVQAQSLLEQRTSVPSRLQSLKQQGNVWGDDEIRWHLYRLQNISSEKATVFVIEPLVVHGCFINCDFRAISQWVIVNHRMNAFLITVVLQDRHWYPVLVHITWEGLKITTWDLPDVSHKGLDRFVQCIAETLNLPAHSVFQLERRFSGSRFCGALSIAFLERSAS